MHPSLGSIRYSDEVIKMSLPHQGWHFVWSNPVFTFFFYQCWSTPALRTRTVNIGAPTHFKNFNSRTNIWFIISWVTNLRHLILHGTEMQHNGSLNPASHVTFVPHLGYTLITTCLWKLSTGGGQRMNDECHQSSLHKGIMGIKSQLGIIAIKSYRKWMKYWKSIQSNCFPHESHH